MYHTLLATYCVQKEQNKTEKNPKTKKIRCFIDCSPNTVKHKRTKIYTIPYKVYLSCLPFLQFQPLTTLKLNYRPLSSLKKSENMAKKEKCFKIPCGNNDHISLFCSPLNYTRKKTCNQFTPASCSVMIVSVAFPDQYYLWVKVTYIILMFLPLSNATCCTYKHGLVNVTRNVSLSSVPANDLLSCEHKKMKNGYGSSFFQVTEIGLSKATLAIIPQKVIQCIFLLIVVQTDGCTRWLFVCRWGYQPALEAPTFSGRYDA